MRRSVEPRDAPIVRLRRRTFQLRCLVVGFANPLVPCSGLADSDASAVQCRGVRALHGRDQTVRANRPRIGLEERLKWQVVSVARPKSTRNGM